MSKRIALKDFVEIDGVDLSNFCRSVQPDFNDAEQDASGFNETGSEETLQGTRSQAITFEFFGSYATGEVHQTLYPIWRDREVVEIKWRPDQTAVPSATNPELRGNARMFGYSPGATRGDVEVFPVTFRAADEDGLVFENDS